MIHPPPPQASLYFSGSKHPAVVSSASVMEDQGGKNLKRPCHDHVDNPASVTNDDAAAYGGKNLKRPCHDHADNPASVTNDAAAAAAYGREAQANVKGKHPCVDLDQSFVENSSSASAAASASGTNAEVTEGSIFKILADRKAFKCPREEDLVNSASATTGTKAQVKGKRPRVENPSSASATFGTNEEVTGRGIFTPLSLYMHPLAYGLDPSEIRFEFHLEEGRVVTKVKELRPRRKCPKKSVPPGPDQQLRRAAYVREEDLFPSLF